MPDALKLLTTRRSFKPIELTGPAPSPAEIDQLLTVASRVPDHGSSHRGALSCSRATRGNRRATPSPPRLRPNIPT